jgi:ActR/RegA family two-component response regulator
MAQGRKSAAQRELRDRIDRRLLEVADAGGNLSLLARVLEVHPHTFQRALARARAA